MTPAAQLESFRGRPRFFFELASAAAEDVPAAALEPAPPSSPVEAAAEPDASGFLRGRPRFFLVGGSDGSPPSFLPSSSDFRFWREDARVSARSGERARGARGETEEGESRGSGVRTFGGRPRGRFWTSVEAPEAAARASAASVFLFLLPGGRPRLRLGGGPEGAPEIARSTAEVSTALGGSGRRREAS